MFSDDCWHARFTIDPGEPVRIRTLDVAVTGEAEHDSPFTEALAQAGLAVGNPLDHGAYDRLRRRLTEVARERGYADARFTANRIDVFPDEHAADIALMFDSGPRYAFGPTEITQDVLTDELISSYFTFDEGQPYDARQLVDVYAALADSGFFRTNRRAAAAAPGHAHDPDRRHVDGRAAPHAKLRHRLIDGHAAAPTVRPQ